MIRVDLDREGNEIPRDWTSEPVHGPCAAFTPDKQRFVGYGATGAEARDNAEQLRQFTLREQSDPHLFPDGTRANTRRISGERSDRD